MALRGLQQGKRASILRQRRLLNHHSTLSTEAKKRVDAEDIGEVERPYTQNKVRDRMAVSVKVYLAS